MAIPDMEILAVRFFCYVFWLNNTSWAIMAKQYIRVYLALVQSVLLYASETWTLTVADSKSLDAFHMKCQEYLGINSCGTKRSPLSLVFPLCRTSSVADVQPYLVT